MNTEEYLSYRNFLNRLNEYERNTVYAIIGYCVENKTPPPFPSKDWDVRMKSVYTSFNNEQKNILSRLVKEVLKKED